MQVAHLNEEEEEQLSSCSTGALGGGDRHEPRGSWCEYCLSASLSVLIGTSVITVCTSHWFVGVTLTVASAATPALHIGFCSCVCVFTCVCLKSKILSVWLGNPPALFTNTEWADKAERSTKSLLASWRAWKCLLFDSVKPGRGGYKMLLLHFWYSLLECASPWH